MREWLIANPHGFCSGVARAVQKAHEILAAHPGERVYCLHEIVHNEHVVSELLEKGMVFVKEVEEVPDGAILLFSAHGVSPKVREAAAKRRLRVVDATCPFVAKVHDAVRDYAAQGAHVICIGHRKHDEVVGVSGEAPDRVTVVQNEEEARTVSLPGSLPLALVTQTTLGADQVDATVEVLRRRFPDIRTLGENNICYATRHRQQAVRDLAKRCDWMLILGSANSSNSNRLVEVARASGAKACLISTMKDLDSLVFPDSVVLGLTSGASTPESFLEEVIAALGEKGFLPGKED